MLEPVIIKNDRKAYWLIGIFSVAVFAAISVIGEVKLNWKPGFDVHIFATLNACINSTVALLLLSALWAVRRHQYLLHRNLMLAALTLSVIFLMSYIAHHILAGEAHFGDSNHDGILSAAEKAAAGNIRYVYYLILGTHILLASVILPVILFTAYRGLTADFARHKKIARLTWPIWFYVAVTGPIVYWMIRPYYL